MFDSCDVFFSYEQFLFRLRLKYKELSLDIVWAISVSLAGIGVTTVILAKVNILVGRSARKNNNTKTNGLVR